jgi:polyhydroxyalkanoate synthesis regulator phasin
MAKRKQAKEFTPREALRRGWLAYIGAYGVAYDRAKPVFAKLTERYSELFGEFVEKGEEIEATAKEQMVDVRDRAKSLTSAGFEKLQGFVPALAANDRIEDVAVEAKKTVKKVAAKARKTTRAVKRAVKEAA